MIGYYKNFMIEMVSSLRELNNDKSNFRLLLNIQRALVNKLIYVENRILKLNQEYNIVNKLLSQRGLLKSDAKNLKKRKAIIKDRKDEYLWLLFVFRTIGDGIAFSYLDKWDIRPLAFKDNAPDYKESPGFMSGKAGLQMELKKLRSAIDHGVPALLTDITNCIRHGDICLLGAGMPRLMEVKSSKNSNARVFRQAEGLKNVQSYIDKDISFGLRGYSMLQRHPMNSPEINYTETLNELIEIALRDRFSCREVEPGVVYYVQLANVDLKNFQECSQKIRLPFLYYLNQLKNDEQWIYYYPFTLSIRNSQYVYKFLCSEIQIIVLIDFEVIEDYARKKGFEAKIFDDLDVASMKESFNNRGVNLPYNDRHTHDLVEKAVLFRNPKLKIPEGSMIVSFQYLNRTAYEFTSLQWLLDQIFSQYQFVSSQIGTFLE